MNHIEQYEAKHGPDATKIYAFTVIQIQLIQGMSLLHSGDLSEDEEIQLTDKLTQLSSLQLQMYAKHIPVDTQAVTDAMEAASDYMTSESHGETIQ
jgi:hypothetical protein